MTEEYLYQREQDLLDYFRNNITDPDTTRSTEVTETFTATASQTEFTLHNPKVRNVADTIVAEGTTYRKGYDYTVSYGEGNQLTTVTFDTGFTLADSVPIVYTYGSSLIEREFSRSDTKLPRIIMITLSGAEDFAGLGDTIEDGTGSYMNMSYRFEVRDKYASRVRILASQAMNLGKKLRHGVLFRTNISRISDYQNLDFDPDKEAYIIQFTLDVQWEVIFQ